MLSFTILFRKSKRRRIERNRTFWSNSFFRNRLHLVLEELENSYILGLLEYPDIEMDFYTPKDVVIEIQENTEEYKKAKQIILNKLKWKQ